MAFAGLQQHATVVSEVTRNGQPNPDTPAGCDKCIPFLALPVLAHPLRAAGLGDPEQSCSSSVTK